MKVGQGRVGVVYDSPSWTAVGLVWHKHLAFKTFTTVYACSVLKLTKTWSRDQILDQAGLLSVLR
jgi:hypothetical protein